jgi:hypothetical protein
MLATCMLCNIQIYFCNIQMKHLEHTSKKPKILDTYDCNMKHTFATYSLKHGITYGGEPRAGRFRMPRWEPAASDNV